MNHTLNYTQKYRRSERTNVCHCWQKKGRQLHIQPIVVKNHQSNCRPFRRWFGLWKESLPLLPKIAQFPHVLPYFDEYIDRFMIQGKSVTHSWVQKFYKFQLCMIWVKSTDYRVKLFLWRGNSICQYSNGRWFVYVCVCVYIRMCFYSLLHSTLVMRPCSAVLSFPFS